MQPEQTTTPEQTMRLPTRSSLFVVLPAFLLAGCSAEPDSPSGAARITFALFLLFLAGIFFVGPHSSSFLNNPRFTSFLQRHVRRLSVISYLLGAGAALAALLAAFLAGQGRIEAFCISLIILGLCFVLIAFCLKRWEETHEKLWLRRNVQILYAGVICFSAINALLRGS